MSDNSDGRTLKKESNIAKKRMQRPGPPSIMNPNYDRNRVILNESWTSINTTFAKAVILIVCLPTLLVIGLLNIWSPPWEVPQEATCRPRSMLRVTSTPCSPTLPGLRLSRCNGLPPNSAGLPLPSPPCSKYSRVKKELYTRNKERLVYLLTTFIISSSFFWWCCKWFITFNWSSTILAGKWMVFGTKLRLHVIQKREDFILKVPCC